MRARADFNRGLILGRLEKQTGFKFKYNTWAEYPVMELEELMTLALAMFAYQDTLANESKIKKVEIPENVKQQNLARSKGMYAALSKK